jgi:hypothetical protein
MDTKVTEVNGTQIISSFIKSYKEVKDIILISQKELQLVGLDALIVYVNGKSTSCEFKTEYRLDAINLFMEDHLIEKGNNRITEGWVNHLVCDKLFYLFLPQRILYVLDWFEFYQWYLENKSKYPCRPQRIRAETERRIAWGYLIKITDIPSKIIKQFNLTCNGVGVQ